jgi:hypothetical protein
LDIKRGIIKDKLEKIKDKISETEETNIDESDDEYSVEGYPVYNVLPRKAQDKVSEAYKKLKRIVNKSFDKIKTVDEDSVEKTLDKLVLPDEKLDKKPLILEYHHLKSYDETINKRYRTNVYTTDKRILLLNAKTSSYPSLETKHGIKVSHTSEDSFRVFSIPTKHIDSISLDMKSYVSAFSFIDKINYLWLIAIGILISFFSFFFGAQDHSTDPLVYILLVGLGVILIIIALLLINFKIGKTDSFSRRGVTIYLSVTEPFYHRRAILELKVNTEIHNIEEIVRWTDIFQQRCKNIV